MSGRKRLAAFRRGFLGQKQRPELRLKGFLRGRRESSLQTGARTGTGATEGGRRSEQWRSTAVVVVAAGTSGWFVVELVGAFNLVSSRFNSEPPTLLVGWWLDFFG